MKKSQAAMEFLMTYGWAVMIIFIVVGSLFYLGIFDFPVPTTCDIPNPYICRDLKIDSASSNKFTIRIEAVNIDPASAENKVKSITINGITCTPTSPMNTDLKTASEVPVNIECTNYATPLGISKGSKYEGTIVLGYQKLGGSVREVTGSFSGKVE